MMTLLIIGLFGASIAAVYLYGRHQLLASENARLLSDNAALRDKLLAKHGYTPLHETAETKTNRRAEQSISLVPPIHAAIQADEAAEERSYLLSEEKQAELREAARAIG